MEKSDKNLKKMLNNPVVNGNHQKFQQHKESEKDKEGVVQFKMGGERESFVQQQNNFLLSPQSSTIKSPVNYRNNLFSTKSQSN